MASPVGSLGATTLTNNNGSSNNTNNSSFSLNMLKEGDGTPVEFTTAHQEVGKISTRWTYTFLNGITYYDWLPLAPATTIAPGVGYISKGTGNAGLTQEYLFEGKPNNGTVLIAADDVDGDSGNESQPDVTQTTTLIGNPYASAIDAHQFINDNAGVIDGTIYLWQQWAGDNHILEEYQGGYAVINLMSKIRAYQFVGYSGADNGSQDGTKTPTQFIGVGQSFMTEVVGDGNIEFNNGQRAYKRESNGEVEFFRTTETTQEKQLEDPMQILTLEFKTSSNLSREIAVGFSGFTSKGFDYGYDGKMFDAKTEDMYTMWNDQKMITQAYPAINSKTVVPLEFNITGELSYAISIKDMENFQKGQKVYLRDNTTGMYFDLTEDRYKFNADPQTIDGRFDIVFEKEDTKPTKGQTIEEDVVIYYNSQQDLLYVKGLLGSAKDVILYNTAGQKTQSYGELSEQTLEQGIRINNISSGIYMVSLQTQTNQTINKKIIVD